MFWKAGGVGIRGEAGAQQEGLQEVAVVPRRFALPQTQDVPEHQQKRDDRDPEGGEEGGFHANEEAKEDGDTGTDPPDQPPDQVVSGGMIAAENWRSENPFSSASFSSSPSA